MLAIGHTAVGVIVGFTAYQFLGQGDLATGLAIAGAAGIVSHYIADFIPHGHFVKPKKLKQYLPVIIFFDLFLPIFLILGGMYLKDGFNEKLLYILFAIASAQLPDVLDGLIFINVFKRKGLIKTEYDFHQGLHWHGRDDKTLLLGIYDIWQIAMILFALYLVITR